MTNGADATAFSIWRDEDSQKEIRAALSIVAALQKKDADAIRRRVSKFIEEYCVDTENLN